MTARSRSAAASRSARRASARRARAWSRRSAELAAETGLEPEEIAAAETATGPTESLQKENGETGFTLEHTLGDYDQEERMVEYAALREALRQLPERERQVIALRFYHGLTQQRAAGILHISQVQVSRLERRAVERLREWLAT